MVIYRNIRARDLLEIFLISAGTSVLLVRFFLHITDYPQLGGGGFHVAHMLWGGLLMMVSIVITLAFLGGRVQRLAALIGGLGFGVFIDEIGKFITRDNNYFYHPAVGIIYAIFAVLYLTFSFMTRGRKLTSREYQLNALLALEEALSHDLDEAEKAQAQAMLDQADPGSDITKELKKLFVNLSTVPRPPLSPMARLLGAFDHYYQKFWDRRRSGNFVRAFFIAEATFIILGVLVTFATNLDVLLRFLLGKAALYDVWLLVGELVSGFVACVLVIRGAFILNHSRLEAFERFRMATLVNLLLTEFFRFSRLELAALPDFFLSLVLFIFISYAIQQERRVWGKI